MSLWQKVAFHYYFLNFCLTQHFLDKKISCSKGIRQELFLYVSMDNTAQFLSNSWGTFNMIPRVSKRLLQKSKCSVDGNNIWNETFFKEIYHIMIYFFKKSFIPNIKNIHIYIQTSDLCNLIFHTYLFIISFIISAPAWVAWHLYLDDQWQ